MKEIYLDNAAATPIDPKVQTEMVRGMKFAGNPSSYNDSGRQAADMLEKARSKVARFLSARSQEIIFTSSGSEANSLAIFGVAKVSDKKFRHILTTPIEHMSVIEPVVTLVKDGYHTEFLPVDHEGTVVLDRLQRMLRKNTLMVSVMYANNEIGTIEPIQKIGKIIRAFREKHGSEFPLFHVDACQATEYLDMNVQQLGADLLTFNGSKVYGPRGVGVLYARQGIALRPIVLGGGQEQGMRAGTENVPAIMGLARALELIKSKEGKKTAALRDYFFNRMGKIMPNVRVNGSEDRRLPNNINISIPGLDSENMLLELDRHGIRAGSGSACTARSVEPSHVLRAIGIRKPYLDGALRFSLGRTTTKKDIDYLLEVLPKIVTELKNRYNKVEKNR
ncbi:MAG: cysteine desulfurase family protein [Candidatus Yanofskybacteria bacterium]|nr:cysteine desulfurase family protein [Candidatus Yanofskybacteria bacterium]